MQSSTTQKPHYQKMVHCLPTISAHTIPTHNKITPFEKVLKHKNFPQAAVHSKKELRDMLEVFFLCIIIILVSCCHTWFLVHIIFSFSSNILDLFLNIGCEVISSNSFKKKINIELLWLFFVADPN